MAVRQPYFRILIPTTQLRVLNHLNPSLRVYEVTAAGSFSGVRTTLPFTYGRFQGVLTGRAEISWAANSLNNSVPLSTILGDLQNLTTVADAVVDSITFYERVVIHKYNMHIDMQLRFEKGNVHPQIMREIVVNPAGFPLGGTYDMLVDFKNNVARLPPDVRRHWKPGYLLLTDIPTNRNYMLDVSLMWSLMQQRFPNAILVTDTVHNWNLRDLQSIMAFRRATPRTTP